MEYPEFPHFIGGRWRRTSSRYINSVNSMRSSLVFDVAVLLGIFMYDILMILMFYTRMI